MFVLVIFVCSCETEGNKEIRENKIDSLKQVVSLQNEDFKKYEESIKKLENVKLSVLENLKKDKDSIADLLAITNAIDATGVNNIFKDYYKPIDYEISSADGYWKRGVYYTSENTGEYFYNVRTSIVDDQLRFYFMGVKSFKEEELLATIYELDENKELHIIDTVNIFQESAYLKGEIHTKDCMLLQLGNLIVKDGSLYYFKINELTENEVDNREFYKYSIGSKSKPEKVNNYIFSNVVAIYRGERKIISPDKTKLAMTYFSDNFSLFKIENWQAIAPSLYTKPFYNMDSEVDNKEKLSEIKFDFEEHFYFTKDGGYMTDNKTDKSVFIGGVCWHSTKNVLYFDNSGIDKRCIWKVNFDANEIIKIVPEHEAIHPYFFKVDDKEYIVYVEENKIMLCEPPSNEN